MTSNATTPQDPRRDALAAFLADVQAKFGLGFAFHLWDGVRVPADAPDDALAVTVADAGVVAQLIRRPKLDTLIALHVDGRIDIRNGSIFDIAAARPEGKVARLARGLDKGKALGVARRFLFAPRGPISQLDAGGAFAAGADGRPETNRANIAYHYDVSNEFYALFLDREMLYSCAYFADDHHDIDRAQQDKLDMICRKLRLKPGERFLDIGCGWGALVRHAAMHYGVEAHGVTLAAEQLAHAQGEAQRLGLSDRITLHLKDYSTLEGQFDKIASIGMFEHVGLDNHARYFATVNRLLRPGGLYLHHTIARRAKRSERRFRRGSPEFQALVRYIFPGGELDHLGMSIANLERAGFEVHDVEGWREHYRRTTRLWYDRLAARRDEAVALVGER